MTLFRWCVAWAARFGINPEVLTRVIVSALVLLGYVVAGRIVRRVLTRTVDDPSSRYQLNKAGSYVLGAVALVILLYLWTRSVSGLATYFGLLSAGLALALQDPIINLAGWLFI